MPIQAFSLRLVRDPWLSDLGLEKVRYLFNLKELSNELKTRTVLISSSCRWDQRHLSDSFICISPGYCTAVTPQLQFRLPTETYLHSHLKLQKLVAAKLNRIPPTNPRRPTRKQRGFPYFQKTVQVRHNDHANPQKMWQTRRSKQEIF